MDPNLKISSNEFVHKGICRNTPLDVLSNTTNTEQIGSCKLSVETVQKFIISYVDGGDYDGFNLFYDIDFSGER